jgi:hypothetical protein
LHARQREALAAGEQEGTPRRGQQRLDLLCIPRIIGQDEDALAIEEAEISCPQRVEGIW